MSSGAATKILEYVPMMIPKTIEAANPKRTGPPRSIIAMPASKVVPDVISVRDIVAVIDMSMTWASGSFLYLRNVSRIRSNTTTVSLIE